MIDSEAVLRADIAKLLQSCSALALATLSRSASVKGVADVQEPWAAQLFFVSDENLNLYFVSSPESRHCQDLLRNPHVAATISGDTSDWLSVKGLQIRGRAKPLPKSQYARVLALYLGKSPQLQALYQRPANPNEEKIRQRLMDANFYRIDPVWIRVIDNSRGFSHKCELKLDSFV
tara:strand:- start:7649 stop:8176 length:528 start_codon:yes stop_codon:yes gene_type:complete